MNTMFFQDLVHGRYGREIAYSSVEKVTEQNIVSVVGSCVGVFNSNKGAIDYLWKYYHGDQPVLYRRKKVRDEINNPVVENHAYEIVQFKVGQSYGEPILCVARKKDDKINEYVDILNDYLADSFKAARDITMGEWQSAVGTAFKAAQFADKNADVPFRITVPTPMNTFCIYSTATGEQLLSVMELKDDEGNWYKQCYTDTHQCVIRDGKVEGWSLHAFGGNPIVEYPNNSERISDIELVVTMLDAINEMQSNRMDSISQFVQSFMKFINCEIDAEKFKAMKDMGAFMIKSNNGDNKADVDIMSQELKQSEAQVAKNDLLDNAMAISAMPTKEGGGSKGGDSQGAVELRAGWDFAKTRTKLKDPLIKESEKKLIKVLLNIIRIRKGADECPITVRDIEINIPHNPSDQMIVRAQALQYLLTCGIHPLVAMKTCGLWGDVEKVFTLSKPYLDNLYKTVDDVQAEETKAQELLDKYNKQNTQNE